MVIFYEDEHFELCKMKVIVAGYAKTGTKSMNAALTELGYKVYDSAEHFFFHYEEWSRIFAGKGCIDDFKTMYKDVDAVTDHPANVFWQEIQAAFPEAKIILTTRDEESWYKSLVRQLDEVYKNSRKFLDGLTIYVLPFVQKAQMHVKSIALQITGRPTERNLFGFRMVPDPLICKQYFRKHNAYVLQEAPKDKLLIYDVKQGWEPLCKFLGKEVPDKPFPWKNIGGKNFIPEQQMQKIKKQLMKEAFIFFIVLLAFISSIYFYYIDSDYWKFVSPSLFGFLTWFYFLRT